MKILSFAFIVCILSSAIAFSQENERPRLESDLSRLISAGELLKAIPVAEKIVKVEKKRVGENSPDYASALLNYTVILSRSFDLGDERLSISAWERNQKTLEKRDLIVKNFRSLIAMYQGKLNDPSEGARTQSELGMFLYRKCEKNKAYDDCVNESAALLSAAADFYEKQPSSSSNFISILAKLGSIYWARANFEDFTPVYHRYAAAVEKLGKPNELDWIYAEFLLTIGSESQAAAKWEDFIKRVGAKDAIFSPHKNIRLRAESKTDVFFGKLPAIGLMQAEPSYGILDMAILRSNMGPPARLLPVILGPSPVRLGVLVTIDEKGSVIDVKPDPVDEKMAAEIKERVAKWKFRPYIHEGVARKLTGRMEVFVSAK